MILPAGSNSVIGRWTGRIIPKKWLFQTSCSPALGKTIPLVAFAKTATVEASARAFEILKSFVPDAKVAVPGLIEIIQGGDPAKVSNAIAVLRYIGPHAAEAVPCLVKSYKKGDAFTRQLAGSALKVIDEEAAKRAGVPWANKDYACCENSQRSYFCFFPA